MRGAAFRAANQPARSQGVLLTILTSTGNSQPLPHQRPHCIHDLLFVREHKIFQRFAVRNRSVERCHHRNRRPQVFESLLRDLGRNPAERSEEIEATSGKGSSVGRVTMAQIREIAEQKMQDLNAKDIDGACRMLIGSARSMGLDVVE